MMPSFHSPWAILLIIPFAFAIWRELVRKRPSILFSNLSGHKEKSGKQNIFRLVNIPVFITTVGILLMLIALMRPRTGVGYQVKQSEGVDIMLLLDVSGSMKGYDAPGTADPRDVARKINAGTLKNRIDTAKQALTKFVESRPDDRIGIIAFAGVPLVVSPPTLDHDYLLTHLDMLDAGMIRDSSTGIAAPIASATTRLKGSPAKRRVAVLFTDGADNVQADISPLEAAELAGKKDISIHTVGIGSDHAFGIGTFGRLVQTQSEYDEKLMKKIADKTAGRFFKAEDSEGFDNVMKEIDSLEKVEMEAPTYIDYTEKYFPWLLAGILISAFGLLLEDVGFLQIP